LRNGEVMKPEEFERLPLAKISRSERTHPSSSKTHS